MKRLMAFLLMLLMLPALAMAEDGYAYVSAPTSDRVHLRAMPSADSESLGLYFTGTQVQTGSAYFNTEWVCVTIGTETGYIRRDCLSQSAPLSAAPLRYVANPHSTWVHLRQAPSTQSQSLGRFDNGTAVSLLGETASGWSYVLAGGQKGYMITGMLSAASSTAPTFSPVATAGPEPGQTMFEADTIIVGYTSQGNYIHTYAAPNGQIICFDAMEEHPLFTEADVNFDGRADLVVFVSMGASNAYCEFFVFDGTSYHYVEHPGIEYGLANYNLHPQQGLVSTHANNGSAGALHEDCLFRWNGTELDLIRRAEGVEYTETQSFSDRIVYTSYHDKITFSVYDYTTDSYEGRLIFSDTVDHAGLNGDIFERESNALWQGLR